MGISSIGTICAIEHRKNLRQGHGADLHAAQGELFARDPAGEVVHQFFLAHGEALDDACFLPLERLSFENLGNAAAQKVDAGFDFFLESVGLAARESEQARAVGILEIVDVAAIGRGLACGCMSFDHADDHAAAAGAGKSADEKIVAWRGQFDAHAQRAQGAFLAWIAGGRRRFPPWSETEWWRDRSASGVFPAAGWRVSAWSFLPSRLLLWSLAHAFVRRALL